MKIIEKNIKYVSYILSSNILYENCIARCAGVVNTSVRIYWNYWNFLAEDGAYPSEKRKCALRKANEVTYRLRTKTRLIYK